jgi:hypothetical protein
LVSVQSQSRNPGSHSLHNAAAIGYGALMTALMPQFGPETVGLLAIVAIGVLALASLPVVVSLLRSDKPRPADEPWNREFSQADTLTDSQLAGQI